MRRRALAAIPAAAVLLATAPFATGTAAAGTPGPTVQSTDGGAVAFFEDDGDDLYICDARADGHSATVQWIDGRNPGKVRTYRNSGGNGTCKNALAGVNLAEGSGIVYYACLQEGSKIYNCGEIGKGKA